MTLQAPKSTRREMLCAGSWASLALLSGCARRDERGHPPQPGSAPARRRPRYSVLDFGAVGDGVHDDTSAIQATIHAAEAASGEAFFPPPRTAYRTRMARIERGGIIIRGAASSVLQVFDSERHGDLYKVSGVFFLHGCSNVAVEGLVFRTAESFASHNAYVAPVIVRNAEHVRIVRCGFSGGETTRGVFVHGGHDVTIEENTFLGNGITVHPPYDAGYNALFYEQGPAPTHAGPGEPFWAPTRIVIRRNTFVGSPAFEDRRMVFLSGTTDFEVVENTLERLDCSVAIYIYVNDWGLYGTAHDGSQGEPLRVMRGLIARNRIQGIFKRAIYVRGRPGMLNHLHADDAMRSRRSSPRPPVGHWRPVDKSVLSVEGDHSRWWLQVSPPASAGHIGCMIETFERSLTPGWTYRLHCQLKLANGAAGSRRFIRVSSTASTGQVRFANEPRIALNVDEHGSGTVVEANIEFETLQTGGGLAFVLDPPADTPFYIRSISITPRYHIDVAIVGNTLTGIGDGIVTEDAPGVSSRANRVDIETNSEASRPNP